MTAEATWFAQPRGLTVLFLTNMWEQFSYYGMRALLVYYMTKELLFGQAHASLIYGTYIAVAYFTPIIAELIDRRFVIEENGYGLSLVVDPRERQRVAERQVTLRADRFGLRWPDDFPDPAKRQIVRSALLALASEPGTPSPRRGARG